MSTSGKQEEVDTLKFDKSNEEEEINNKSKISQGSINSNKNSSHKSINNIQNNKNNSNNSSFNVKNKRNSLNVNQRYNNDKDILSELDDVNGKEFISTGKFMQITPHFNIFDKQINSLRESIYDDTKRCLMLKSSLQESENMLKDLSSDVIKEILVKIMEIRDLFDKGNKGLNQTKNEVSSSLEQLKLIQNESKKEINECNIRISECETQIGYHLLGKPCYSFMEKNNITQFKDKNRNNEQNENNDEENEEDNNSEN